MRNQVGQTLVEFVASVGIATAFLAGGVALFRTEWERTRCAHLAFEAAHQTRIGAPYWSLAIRTSDTGRGVQAVARCRDLRESVELPYLESLR